MAPLRASCLLPRPFKKSPQILRGFMQLQRVSEVLSSISLLGRSIFSARSMYSAQNRRYKYADEAQYKGASEKMLLSSRDALP